MRLSNILAVVFAISTAVLSWLYFGNNTPGAKTSVATSDSCCEKLKKVKQLASLFADNAKKRDTKRTDSAHTEVPLPMDDRYAQDYIKAFKESAAYQAMGEDRIENLYFDEETLASFSDLYINSEINGLRVYLARYNGNGSDLQANGTKYTLIMVGTRDRQDALILQPGETRVFRSLQNYGDPCTPNCNGATLGEH